MQTRHQVVWRIDVYAENTKDAAKQAWEAMRSLNSTANYFEVFDQDGVQTNVDLSEDFAEEDAYVLAMAERHGY
jgi:hypothetical protein